MQMTLYGKIKCPRGWSVVHSGIFNRIYYILGGKTEYMSDGYTEILMPGRLYLFPAVKPYSIIHDPDYPLECVYFHVRVIPTILNQLIRIDVTGNDLLKNTLILSENLMKYDSPSKKKQLENVVSNIVHIIMDNYHTQTYSDPRIVEIIDFIEKRYMLACNNLQLAEIIGLNVRQFLRLFKKMTGVSPSKYLCGIRMEHAKLKLLTGHNIAETAYGVGYQDAKAFSRSFKEYCGKSPKEFRQHPTLFMA